MIDETQHHRPHLEQHRQCDSPILRQVEPAGTVALERELGWDIHVAALHWDVQGTAWPRAGGSRRHACDVSGGGPSSFVAPERSTEYLDLLFFNHEPHRK